MSYMHNGPYRYNDPEHDDMDDRAMKQWLASERSKRLPLNAIERIAAAMNDADEEPVR